MGPFWKVVKFAVGVCKSELNLVLVVCNANVFRDVTKFLTARVQMKKISTCIIINLIQASQSGESESIWKDVF
jgi:hypothetical protein